MLALAVLWLGLAEFVRLILLSILRVQPADLNVVASWWRRFAYAAAGVLVGAPAWWGHWWAQQVRARRPDPFGQAERGSPVRRAYLHLVSTLGMIATVAALGVMVFLMLNAHRSPARRFPARQPSPQCRSSGRWGMHDRRGDARWQAADRAAAAAQSAEPAPLIQTSRRRLCYPRPYPHLSAIGAQICRLLLRLHNLRSRSASSGAPLVVMDGGDGAVGAALIAALRRTLPDVTLWPIGLNADAQMAMLNVLGGSTPPAVPADALDRAAAVLGPSDVLVAGGLDGDVTAEMVAALASGKARMLLLPPRDPRLRWVAAPAWPLERWIENAVAEAADAVGGA